MWNWPGILKYLSLSVVSPIVHVWSSSQRDAIFLLYDNGVVSMRCRKRLYAVANTPALVEPENVNQDPVMVRSFSLDIWNPIFRLILFSTSVRWRDSNPKHGYYKAKMIPLIHLHCHKFFLSCKLPRRQYRRNAETWMRKTNGCAANFPSQWSVAFCKINYLDLTLIKML